MLAESRANHIRLFVTEVTEREPELTEKDSGIWSRKVWMYQPGEYCSRFYSDATLCALLLASVLHCS